MAKLKKPDQKTLELKRTGTLNPRPDAVSDTLFRENPFFDRKDLLQVRYEMLRRHSMEGVSIVDVAATFGVSRPTVYQAQAAFQQAGLSGLLPKHRGPKEGTQAVRRCHRVCADLASCRAHLDDRRLCPSRSERVRYHGSPSQSGAGVGGQKKTAQFGVRSPIPEGAVEAYEGLRRQVVQPDGRGEHLEGRGVLMRCGLATWAQIRPASVPARPPEWHFPSGAEVPVLDSFGSRTRPPGSRSDSQHSTGGFSACLN